LLPVFGNECAAEPMSIRSRLNFSINLSVSGASDYRRHPHYWADDSEMTGKFMDEVMDVLQISVTRVETDLTSAG
jgi:hypothetical protein